MRALLAAGILIDNMIIHPDGNDSKDAEIVLPTFDEDIQLCSVGALKCYNGEISVLEARDYGDPYKPMVFEYDLNGTDGVLRYSERSDLSNSVQILLNGNEKSVQINNLKTGTRYYYEVTVNQKKYSGSFKTASSTRFLNVEGLYNARDIGGYVNKDGKTVKQGMIIRGTEIDGIIEPGYRIPEKSVQYMIDTFCFVYDMDLRAEFRFESDFKTYFGDGIDHAFYSILAYEEVFDPSCRDGLKRIFSDMAKEENYPMYVHCTYGADRTGTVIFLLQGVLDLSNEQMIREYQLSGLFSSKYADSTQYEAIINGVMHKSGCTLQEKIVSFLIEDVGVTQEEIDSIRSILLE